jgi:hypothetical protein
VCCLVSWYDCEFYFQSCYDAAILSATYRKNVHHLRVHSTSYTVLDDRISIPLNVRRVGWSRIISTLQQTSRKHLATCFHDVYLMLTNVCPRPTSFLFIWEVWVSSPQNLASETQAYPPALLYQMFYPSDVSRGRFACGSWRFLFRCEMRSLLRRAYFQDRDAHGNIVLKQPGQYDVASVSAVVILRSAYCTCRRCQIRSAERILPKTDKVPR